MRETNDSSSSCFSDMKLQKSILFTCNLVGGLVTVVFGMSSMSNNVVEHAKRLNVGDLALGLHDRYEVDLSVSVHRDNHFLGTFGASAECFAQLELQFHKFFKNHIERLLPTRTY
ncbi:hypothetical protein QTP88_010680 [Uroleucon formosanum]